MEKLRLSNKRLHFSRLYFSKRPDQRRLLVVCGLLLGAAVGYAALPMSAVPRAIAQPQPSLTPSSVRPSRVLTVTGQGRQSIQTTLTQVTLGVAVETRTAEVAQQQAAQRQRAVIDWLRSQNVEKLETTGISLNPRYDYRNDQQELRGYEASNTVSFRAPTEAAGAIIDGAIDAGATRINGVSFVAEDAAVLAARQQALETAVSDAQQQADTVLSALGLSRQEIVNITIGSVSAPPPSPVNARAAFAEAADVSTPVVGQSQTIDAQVTLDIRY